MDKNAIKKYAVWARNELIARITQKAEQYEITEKKMTPADADSINGRVLTGTEKNQRKALIEKIQADGFEQVMEEVAYTWFNRFTALRFMEVNNYLPSHTRVFTNDAGEFKPQILADAIQLDLEGLDMRKVLELKDSNKTEELYKYLLITQCNALSAVLPRMFQKIEDYTELLLPDYLLREGSAIEQMIALIPEDNFDVNAEGGQIEIIGWLYQYYISEKHAEVVDPLHGTVVKKEEIPAATQLFTTDWVVKYIVDNSVGRYWIERNTQSKLADELEFFVTPKNGVIPIVNEQIKPQEVTAFDPCVGSGHFLIYTFDVLMKIYVEYGYTERDAASEIVKNNLFGLDIDGRAAQMAYFAVMMKARQYDRRFLTKGIQPHIFEIVESNLADLAYIDYLSNNNISLSYNLKAAIRTLRDAKEYGSILNCRDIDFQIILKSINEHKEDMSLLDIYVQDEFRKVIEPVSLLSNKYAIVATNPPYLNRFDEKLKTYINKHYADYKGDLFSVFIYSNLQLCKTNGYVGFMTPMVWMFIKSYEKLRKEIIDHNSITTLIQFEYSAFEEATVPICAFVLKKGHLSQKGCYYRLSEFKGGMKIQKEKVIEANIDKNCGWYYEANQENFMKIPGAPIAYWASDTFLDAFTSDNKIESLAEARKGLTTSEDATYLRLWHEVEINKIGFSCKNNNESIQSQKKWFPLNKGGDFRRWYGNNEFIINWYHDGEQLRRFPKSVIRNEGYYFREAISWNDITSHKVSFRYKPHGHIFNDAGPSIFSDYSTLMYLLAFGNTNVMQEICRFIAPTIHYTVGQIASAPILVTDSSTKKEICRLAEENIDISKDDWDSFETSWDFKVHPLVACSQKSDESSCIETQYLCWKKQCDIRFYKIKENEEHLNYIFIKTYGLQHELIPRVDDKDITVRRADLQRDVRSLVSYAVGCMFGRYSLDEAGLIYAGGPWDSSKYKSFHPDTDAIIPICDDEYFDDDILGWFVYFIEVVYGKETLEENLKFIANALGGKGTSREVIRNYFMYDFYVDHLKVYQKRPIYWLFDSGKKNGFKCLVYMHRYKPDTIARIRTDYVHEQQSRYRTAIADLENRINGASTSERVKLNKRLTRIQAQAEEIRVYEEKIHHLADQMISIDLDDGVKHNYEIFKDVLAKIK